MLPAVGLALEALGTEALTPGIMQLAELATSAEDGDIHVPLRSSWLDSFDYSLMSGTLTVNMQDGGSYEYPGTSISTALAFANAPSPGSFYDKNIKLSGKGGSTPSSSSGGREFRIHGI